VSNLISEHIKEGARTVILIDGANHYQACRRAGYEMDYQKLLSTFRKHTTLVRAYYFTALMDDGDRGERDPVRSLVSFLGYNGYCIVSKPSKTLTSVSGEQYTKGNVDVDMTIKAVQLAPSVDNFVLLSGDGDFCVLVNYLQDLGKRVIVISSKDTCADDLRFISDGYIDMKDLRTLLERNRNENGP